MHLFVHVHSLVNSVSPFFTNYHLCSLTHSESQEQAPVTSFTLSKSRFGDTHLNPAALFTLFKYAPQSPYLGNPQKGTNHSDKHRLLKEIDGTREIHGYARHIYRSCG